MVEHNETVVRRIYDTGFPSLPGARDLMAERKDR